MSRRSMYLLGMLILLFLANIAMLMGMTNWPQSVRENFAADVADGKVVPGKVAKVVEKFQAAGEEEEIEEGFMDMLVPGSFGTAPIGTYDGLNMAAKLPPASQGFRARLPNEPLTGPQPGPDQMFYFANNQCKPECCGSTLSCDGGCVCTTPEQRRFINTRGGNRTVEDGF